MRHFLICAVLGVIALSGKAHAEMVPIRSISVNGMAERNVTPDEAHLIVSLGATDMKLANAKAAHDAKLKKLYAIADKNGIERKDMSTQSSSMQPVYQYSDNKQLFKGYRVQSTIDMKVGEIAKTGALVEQVSSSGIEAQDQQEYGQLLSLNYTLSNPDKLRDELLSEAIANARAKADRMASAAGASISRVYQVSEGEVPNYMPRPMMAMAKASGAAFEADAVAPPVGEQKLRSTVTVMYELKD